MSMARMQNADEPANARDYTEPRQKCLRRVMRRKWGRVKKFAMKCLMPLQAVSSLQDQSRRLRTYMDR